MDKGKIGLSKEDVINMFPPNALLTVEKVARIIEANNLKLQEDLDKMMSADKLVDELQRLSKVTKSEF